MRPLLVALLLTGCASAPVYHPSLIQVPAPPGCYEKGDQLFCPAMDGSPALPDPPRPKPKRPLITA